MTLIGKEPTTASTFSANMESAHCEAGYAMTVSNMDITTPMVDESTIYSIVSNLCWLAREGTMSQRDLEKAIRFDIGRIAGLIARGEHPQEHVSIHQQVKE